MKELELHIEDYLVVIFKDVKELHEKNQIIYFENKKPEDYDTPMLVILSASEDCVVVKLSSLLLMFVITAKEKIEHCATYQIEWFGHQGYLKIKEID